MHKDSNSAIMFILHGKTAKPIVSICAKNKDTSVNAVAKQLYKTN